MQRRTAWAIGEKLGVRGIRSVQALQGTECGETAVLISHRFSSVRMADRILVLADGRVEAAGTHEELIA